MLGAVYPNARHEVPPCLVYLDARRDVAQYLAWRKGKIGVVCLSNRRGVLQYIDLAWCIPVLGVVYSNTLISVVYPNVRRGVLQYID